MEVLNTRLNGSVEQWKGVLEAFLHFNPIGQAPLDRLALIHATEEEREAMESVGLSFDYDCETCSFTSYGQRPTLGCTAGCIRILGDLSRLGC